MPGDPPISAPSAYSTFEIHARGRVQAQSGVPPRRGIGRAAKRG